MRLPPVPRLVASRVACMRSGQVVIREVNMTLHGGGAMLLTGPNGSGKSTFLRLLAGFIKPSAGQLLWDGYDLSDPGLYDVYRTQVHLVGSKDAIKPQMSVYENVQFWELLEGLDGGTMPALEYMGIGHYAEREGAVLSLGQRKRLQLARLLAIPRPLWLLDEPSVGLDSQGVKLLEQMIHRHRKEGGMALVATHVPIGLQDYQNLKFPARLHETVQPFGGV
ncbi:hypothetical protein R1flu_018774 [Riccia fluitans]|uniref:ABC transporter domain-containing protein n=1 Tax=Riccia fluitans TaxID=41844 RepID=A0ABD1ZJ28_9MARC